MVERKKARNLRTSYNMRTLFYLGSIAGLVCGARHFLNYLGEHRKIRRLPGAPRKRGGRKDQQVSPRLVSKASPRGVA